MVNDVVLRMPRIGSRRWIAWKLVQLAHRFYDAEYDEVCAVYDKQGQLISRWDIVGSEYGSGVSSQFAPGVERGYRIYYSEVDGEEPPRVGQYNINISSDFRHSDIDAAMSRAQQALYRGLQ